VNEHVDTLLPEWILGILSEETAQAVCTHLQTCAKCTAEWNSLDEAATAFARSLASEKVSEVVRNRILRSAGATNSAHTSQ